MFTFSVVVVDLPIDCILSFLFPAEIDVLVPVFSHSTDVVVVNFVVVLKFPIIKLNKEKFRLRKNELFYMGVVLTDKGVKPDPKKQECIHSMPAPTNKEEVSRLLGVVTYLSRFSKDLSTKSEPIRALLKNDTAFIWEENEQKAFDEIKTLILNTPLVQRCTFAILAVERCLLKHRQ